MEGETESVNWVFLPLAHRAGFLMLVWRPINKHKTDSLFKKLEENKLGSVSGFPQGDRGSGFTGLVWQGLRERFPAKITRVRTTV